MGICHEILNPWSKNSEQQSHVVGDDKEEGIGPQPPIIDIILKKCTGYENKFKWN